MLCPVRGSSTPGVRSQRLELLPVQSLAGAALTGRAAGSLDHGHVEAQWADWLALRDRYGVGREHRYSDAQIRYHYTRDKSVLAHALATRTR